MNEPIKVYARLKGIGEFRVVGSIPLIKNATLVDNTIDTDTLYRDAEARRIGLLKQTKLEIPNPLLK